MSSSAPRDLWSDLAEGDGNVARLFGTARGPASDNEFAGESEIVAAMEQILDRSTLEHAAAVNGHSGHSGRHGRNGNNGHNGRKRRHVNGTKIYRVGELEDAAVDAEIASRRRLAARFDALKAAAVVVVIGVLGLATAAASGMAPWRTLSILSDEPTATETAERTQRGEKSGSDISGGQVGETPPQANVPAGGGAGPTTSVRLPSRFETEEGRGAGSITPPGETEPSPEEEPPHGVGPLCDPPGGRPPETTTTTPTTGPTDAGPTGVDAEPGTETDPGTGTVEGAEPSGPPGCGEDPGNGSTTTTTSPSTTTTTTSTTTVPHSAE